MRAASQELIDASAWRERNSQQPWISLRRAKSNGMLAWLTSSMMKRCSSASRSSLNFLKFFEKTEAPLAPRASSESLQQLDVVALDVEVLGPLGVGKRRRINVDE